MAADTGQFSRMFPGRMAADFSPDGKNIACVAAASVEAKTIGRVDLYNVHDGSLVRSFTSETGPDSKLVAVGYFLARWPLVGGGRLEWNRHPLGG